MISGSAILAKSLHRHDVRTIFFLMGGPMIAAENHCADEGIRMIDVRHEQAAAMAANAYSRATAGPSVCMACSGPGATNLVTGVASAFVDAAPVIAIGGSSPVKQYGMNAFQEVDQVAMFRPITVWAERCYEARRIPEYVSAAFRHAMNPRPGPVYLDLPGDVLSDEIPEADVQWTTPAQSPLRPGGDQHVVDAALELLGQAARPVIVCGSGVLWSGAQSSLQAWVDQSGIPFYTTPQARGVLPEDHALSLLGARSTAFREADCVLVIGTRLNYVVHFARPPRFSAEASVIQINIDASEIGRGRPPTVPIVGDAAVVLSQLVEFNDGRVSPGLYRDWVAHLAAVNRAASRKSEAQLANGQVPIHPLRLCKEVRDFMDRDAFLCVDGQEILNYARQSIPSFVSGRSLNSGPFGTMGVAVPFGIGAKVAQPESQVIVLTGDGSFGLNGMEIDTALRHRLPILCVISNNGGWTAATQLKQGRDLGFTHYEEMARALGCFGIRVEDPEGIRPALEDAKEAVRNGVPAVVNVITDPLAGAGTSKFSMYST